MLRQTETEIQDKIDLGEIELPISGYSSPIVLIPKKDGSVRFCINLWKLNKVTEIDAEPMPNMEEIINFYSCCFVVLRPRLTWRDGQLT